GPVGCTLLAHSDLDFKSLCDSPSLENPLSSTSQSDMADLTGLSQAVTDTITQARALSTSQAYALKWNLFIDWCSACREDPKRCLVGEPVLSRLKFLQVVSLQALPMEEANPALVLL
ncbi:hypothetical protein M9458_002602, partial [Cirrhinus mrigala]